LIPGVRSGQGAGQVRSAGRPAVTPSTTPSGSPATAGRWSGPRRAEHPACQPRVHDDHGDLRSVV